MSDAQNGTNKQKWREEFELGDFGYKLNFDKGADGFYLHPSVELQWNGYYVARKKAQEEIEALKAVINRGDEIKNNWENNEYQEAAHYTKLDDDNEKLQSQLEAANKVIEVLENGHKEIQVIHYLGKNNQPKMYIQSCQALAEVEKIRNGG